MAVSAFFALVVIAAVGFLTAHILVSWIGSGLGLTHAWLHLQTSASETAASLSDYGALVGRNLFFGALVGIILGAIRFKRLHASERFRWMLETVISPDGYNALRAGIGCLLLHVSISLVIALFISWMGVVLPLPHLGTGNHIALLATGSHFALGGGGGDGPPEIALLEQLIAVIVMLAIVAGAIFTLAYWGAGSWVLNKVSWATGVSGAAGEASYRLAAQFGLIMFLVMAGKLRGPPNNRTMTPTERACEIRMLKYEDGQSILHMVFKGLFTGFIHAILYALAVAIGSAVFGLTGN